MKQYSETICDTVINDWTMIPDNLKACKVLLNKKGRPIARKSINVRLMLNRKRCAYGLMK